MGPVLFVAFAEEVPATFGRHNVNCHQYTEDMSGSVKGVAAMRHSQSDSFGDVSSWRSSRRLQLNGAKTDSRAN
jgi:hypothetical protein